MKDRKLMKKGNKKYRKYMILVAAMAAVLGISIGVSAASVDTSATEIDDDTVWYYWDDEDDPADGYSDRTAWTKSSYSVSGWSKGECAFGSKNGTKYGMGDDYPIETKLDQYKSWSTKNIEAYFFRTVVTVDDPDAVESIIGKVIYDDSATIYINGTRVAGFEDSSITENMAYGGGTASDDGDPRTETFEITDEDTISDVLVEGQNIIAVEVHQKSKSSSDVYFDMPYLQFELKESYSITLGDADNGTVSASASESYSGETVTLTTSADDGYSLSSITVKTSGGSTVSVKSSGSGKYTFTMPESNVTVTAEFEKDTYDVTVEDAVGGSVAADQSTDVEWGTTVTLAPEAEEGYSFETLAAEDADGAEVELTENTEDGTWSFTMPQSDVTVTAEFAKDTYDVTVSASEGGSASADLTTDVEWGTTVTITASAEEGYELASVTASAEDLTLTECGDGTYTFEMPQSDVTVTAQFTKIVYSITVNDAENGTAAASAETAVMDDEITVTVDPADGYHLGEISAVDSEGTALEITDPAEAADDGAGDYTFTMPASDVTVTAEFEKDTYDVTVEDAVGGSVAADLTADVEWGTTVTLAPEAEEGYSFETLAAEDADGAEVELTENTEDGSWSFTMPQSDVTVTAVFKKVEEDVESDQGSEDDFSESSGDTDEESSDDAADSSTEEETGSDKESTDTGADTDTEDTENTEDTEDSVTDETESEESDETASEDADTESEEKTEDSDIEEESEDSDDQAGSEDEEVTEDTDSEAEEGQNSTDEEAFNEQSSSKEEEEDISSEEDAEAGTEDELNDEEKDSEDELEEESEEETAAVYTIDISVTEGGRVTSDPSEEAKAGVAVTLTAVADDGYQFSSLTVETEGKSGLMALFAADGLSTEVDLTDNGDGTWSFTMPESNVVITAVFEAVEEDAESDADQETEGGSSETADEAGSESSGDAADSEAEDENGNVNGSEAEEETESSAEGAAAAEEESGNTGDSEDASESAAAETGEEELSIAADEAVADETVAEASDETESETVEVEDNVGTGDSASIAFWVALMAVGAAAVILVNEARRRKALGNQ